MSRLIRHLGALLVGLVIILGAASPATAATITSAETANLSAASTTSALNAASFAAAKNGGATQGAVCSGGDDIELEALPAYRWGDATGGLHTRYSATDLTNVQDRVVSVAFTGVGFSIGNAAWQSTIRFIEIANRACPLDAIGGLVDKNAAKIGNAIMSSGIIAGLVAVSIIGIAFRGMRGGMSWRMMVPKIAALGFFAILLAGASQSTGGGINDVKGNYKPGVGSPGWFAVTVDRTISELTSAPVAALTTDSGDLGVGDGGSPQNGGGRDKYSNSCRYYINGLNRIYEDSYGSTTSEKSLAAVPKSMSAMWEVSGLRAWRKAQFGASNYAGNHMFCYALEKEIDAPVTNSSGDDQFGSIQSVFAKMGVKAPRADSFVWYRSSNNDALDMQLVALAQCRATNKSWTKWDIYQLADVKKHERYKVTSKMCTDAFTKSIANLGTLQTINDTKKAAGFNWPPKERDSGLDNAVTDKISGGILGGSSTIDKYAGSNGNRDFLRALHGDSAGSSIVLTIAFVLSSIMIFAAFGLVAFALLIAKITALMVIFGLYFVLLGMMLPNADSSKIGKFAKQYVGLSFFIFGFQLLLAILVLLTKLMIEMGQESFGDNDFISLLWVGIAPVVSLIAMHIMFKKMGMPSPISMNAGQSWGKAAAAGAIGGAAGGAIGAGMMNNFGRGAARKAGSAATNYAGNKVKGSGTPEDRANRMKPGQRAQTGSSHSELGDTGVGTEALGSVAGNGKGEAVGTGVDEAVGAGVGLTVGEAMAAEAQSKAAAAQERKKARTEHKSETSAAGRAATKAGQSMNRARENMKNKPVRTMGKMAAVGAGLAVAGPGLLLAPAMYVAAKKSVAAVGTAANMDTATNRDALARASERKSQATAESVREEANQRNAAARAPKVATAPESSPGSSPKVSTGREMPDRSKPVGNSERVSPSAGVKVDGPSRFATSEPESASLGDFKDSVTKHGKGKGTK